jgi:hypothetical protein
MVAVILFSLTTDAQCAMCKASAESTLQNGGGGIARGINSGIIYLMGVPYILLGMFCFIFRSDISTVYHRWRKTSPDAINNVFKQYRFLFVFFGILSVLFLIFAYIQLKH